MNRFGPLDNESGVEEEEGGGSHNDEGAASGDTARSLSPANANPVKVDAIAVGLETVDIGESDDGWEVKPQKKRAGPVDNTAVLNSVTRNLCGHVKDFWTQYDSSARRFSYVEQYFEDLLRKLGFADRPDDHISDMATFLVQLDASRPGYGVLLICSDRTVLVVESTNNRAFYPCGPPGGKMEQEDDIKKGGIDTALRELEEECGKLLRNYVEPLIQKDFFIDVEDGVRQGKRRRFFIVQVPNRESPDIVAAVKEFKKTKEVKAIVWKSVAEMKKSEKAMKDNHSLFRYELN